MRSSTVNAAQSGTFLLGGRLPVHRLGFGAMRITGSGVWGPPADRDEAIAVLRRALQLGVNLIDTADSYGPHVSESLIAEALHPYPADLVIATKGGFERPGPGAWDINANPARLDRELDGSLKRLKLNQVHLYQLHRIDPGVPEKKQFEFLRRVREDGRARLIGLSEATAEEIERAREYVDIASVQNRFNLVDREWETVLDYCTDQGIAFIPWYPLQVGKAGEQGGAVLTIAERHRATPAQVALAWLLRRSPVMLPIPGTSRVAHLEENVAAAGLELSAAEMDALS
ncbi:MAG TPA: aldo/keto reductase [Vicinamibacterales bacterium]|nr:aldo/keto reductase [Vicinamibacterales bacterium]